jgi:hypothetical protein
MTIVEDARVITGGVDTHADLHVAAALDPIGGLLGVREFPATAAGYASLLSWMSGFGTLAVAGVEGTGSYGAGLARHLAAAGVRVVEVDRPDRQDRARQGKSDPLDAVSAARAALSGRASGAPRGRDGAVEAIRALMVAKRSARAERTQAINQARALLVTGPEDLRARFARHTPAQLVAALAALRPRPGDVPGYATRVALRELGRRARFLEALGVAHELDVGGHLVPTARGQDGERDAAGVEVDGVFQVPGRGGAALALPLVRRAVVPYVLVDHELVAALEQVQERDRAVGSDDLDRPVELHYRQSAAGRGEGVALAGVGLLADQKLVTGGLPGGQVNDGRAAGQRGGRVVRRGRHGVLCGVSCRAASYDGHQNRLATRPELIAAGGTLGRACTDQVGLTGSQTRSQTPAFQSL